MGDTFSATAAGIPARLQHFEPTRAAALARLQSLQPGPYARTRNALDGAVTGLSPYFTHGLLGLTEAARVVHARHPLSFDDKLVFEWGWREFFHHVWSRADHGGDAILQNMHGRLPWDGDYASSLPADIREGRTGVPAIDTAVRVLYATGYLHNHARMWLASYVVHVRKVQWRAGADWMYGHLIDGDLPSNHLSWQWVAGTFSGKPYLFNAENVARFAPVSASAVWSSAGTVIDQDYDTLDTMAREKAGTGAVRSPRAGVTEPALQPGIPAGSLQAFFQTLSPSRPAPVTVSAADVLATSAADRAIELVHPWALAARAPDTSAFRIGVIHLPAHAAWPWSARRWEFVLSAMAAVVDAFWVGDVAELRSSLQLPKTRRVTTQAVLFPHYREALARVAIVEPAPRLMPNPPMLCRSFTKFYDKVRREAEQLTRLL